MLTADFNLTFFLKQQEVLKLGNKTKLNSAEREKDFVETLLSVDFNNRNEESEYK